jgi:LPXTG-motif cell wall-anchored protein
LPTAVPSLPKTGSSIIPFGIASMVLVIMGAGMIFLL